MYHGILKNFVCCFAALGMFCAFEGSVIAKEVLTPKQKILY